MLSDLGLPGAFGASRLDGLVLVDQSPALVIDPVWDKATIARAGAMFRDEELRSLCRGVADPQSREQVTRQTLTGMVTPACPHAILDQVLAWRLRVDGCYAAALLYNHAQQDWRRNIHNITLPTLVVAGRASIVPWTGAQWIADSIPGAHLYIFEAARAARIFLPWKIRASSTGSWLISLAEQSCPDLAGCVQTAQSVREQVLSRTDPGPNRVE